MKIKIFLVALAIFGLILIFAPTNIKTADAEITTVREQEIQINPRHYGVEPLKSDTQTAIESYERLMQRYMDQTEYNYHMLSAEIQQVMKKLEQIEAKIEKLSPPKPPKNTANDPNNI